MQRARGDLEGALKAYQDSLAIREKLAAQDAGNAEWQRDLSVSFNKIGDVQRARGDLEGALKAYQDSLAIREKLAAQDAGNADWQRDLIVSNVKLAEVAEVAGGSDGQDGPALSGRARDRGGAPRQRSPGAGRRLDRRRA